MAQKIGVGIIGANPDRGWALSAHIPALQALPEFRIAAVSTSRPESAKTAGEKFGVPAFDNAEDLVNHPDVDLVAVTVKVPQHKELATAALKAGKHVYCEWPLGNGLAEAEELAALADASSGKAFVGMQGRFSPAVQQLIQLLKENYVGEILSTTLIGSGGAWGGRSDSSNIYLSDRRNGGSMLTIPLGHTLDAVCLALGEFVPKGAQFDIRRKTVTVTDTGETVTPTVPDQIAVFGTIGEGITTAIHYRGGMSRGTNFLWEINGTDGDLQYHTSTGHIQMGAGTLSGARGTDTLAPIAIEPQYRWVPDSVPAGPAVNVAQAYARVAAALRGEASDAPDFHDAVKRHKMLAAIEALSGF